MIWCTKCQSDVEGVHYASCPDHPTTIALRERKQGRLSEPAQQPRAASEARPATSHPGKADWFSGETTLEFNAVQVNKIMEYFLNNILDLPDVEVVQSVHRAGSVKVTFKQRPVYEEPVVTYSEEEAKVIDEMVATGQVD